MQLFKQAFACLVLTGCLLFSIPAHAQVSPMTKQREITITASGLVSVRPDQAAVRVGVSSNARTAKATLAANTTAMRAIVDALKGAGIEDKDIQTANFNVQPAYEYSQDGKPPKLTGYQVSNAVEVRVRAIDRLGGILDLVVGEGSNQVDSIAFIVSRAEELKDEARKAAVVNATRMAKVYAQAAGVTLGDIQSIAETDNARQFNPVVASMAPRAKAVGPAPNEAGEQTLEAQVTIVWTIK